MEEHKLKIALRGKAVLTTVCTAFAAALSWRGVLALIWVVTMALDYISGSAAALKFGHWSSREARQGLWHKGGTIMVAAVAGLADWILAVMGDHLPFSITWPDLLLPMVLVWYILTEAGSILENAIALGARVPIWLTKALKAGRDAIDNAAGDSQ